MPSKIFNIYQIMIFFNMYFLKLFSISVMNTCCTLCVCVIYAHYVCCMLHIPYVICHTCMAYATHSLCHMSHILHVIYHPLCVSYVTFCMWSTTHAIICHTSHAIHSVCHLPHILHVICHKPYTDVMFTCILHEFSHICKMDRPDH